MKQVYLVDDMVDIAQMLKRIRLWHPYSRLKVATTIGRVLRDDSEVLVVKRKSKVKRIKKQS